MVDKVFVQVGYTVWEIVDSSGRRVFPLKFSEVAGFSLQLTPPLLFDQQVGSPVVCGVCRSTTTRSGQFRHQTTIHCKHMCESVFKLGYTFGYAFTVAYKPLHAFQVPSCTYNESVHSVNIAFTY